MLIKNIHIDGKEMANDIRITDGKFTEIGENLNAGDRKSTRLNSSHETM